MLTYENFILRIEEFRRTNTSFVIPNSKLSMTVYIQGVTGGTDQTSGKGVPYVKLYRKTPKHLCPKLNGLGDNGN